MRLDWIASAFSLPDCTVYTSPACTAGEAGKLLKNVIGLELVYKKNRKESNESTGGQYSYFIAHFFNILLCTREDLKRTCSSPICSLDSAQT